MTQKYGDKRDYKKIDIYLVTPFTGLQYLGSTNWAKNLKVAREQFAKQSDGKFKSENLKAFYS